MIIWIKCTIEKLDVGDEGLDFTVESFLDEGTLVAGEAVYTATLKEWQFERLVRTAWQ